MAYQKAVNFMDERVLVAYEDHFQCYVLAIPISNHFADSMEEYRISEEQYLHFISPEGYNDLIALRDKCRQRLNDDNLTLRPNANRGWPS